MLEIIKATPLYVAIERCNGVKARILIDAGADVDRATDAGDTTLHSAARAGDAATIRLLLEHGGADRSLKVDGQTAFDRAVAWGHQEAARILSHLVKLA